MQETKEEGIRGAEKTVDENPNQTELTQAMDMDHCKANESDLSHHHEWDNGMIR
jgi:hypothetical protein